VLTVDEREELNELAQDVVGLAATLENDYVAFDIMYSGEVNFTEALGFISRYAHELASRMEDFANRMDGAK